MEAPTPAEEHLAQLLGGWLTRFRRGEQFDVAAELPRDPELARELRELWSATVLAERMADSARQRSSGNLSPTGAWDSPSAKATGGASSHVDQAVPRPVVRGDEIAVGDCPPEYELLSELGRGGMGVVYRARQRALDREVALKMMLAGAHASATDRARFQAEAGAAAQLDHPGIVPVFEVGQWRDLPYFTMQFVPGQTLTQRLADGPLPSREAARIVAQVSRAVQYAHVRGVLHRDLKPSNILLDREGRPHVTDFGLARRLEAPAELTRSGAILGTPNYMAPEQAAGQRGQVGPKSDVYALGCVLYHALTGRPPFQAATVVDTVLSLLEQDPLPPRQLNRQVDRSLEQIVLKCLQKPVDLRYASAAALADDLEAYLAGEPISARSGAFGDVVTRLLGATHHAPVLENWGVLWMWHSVVLLALCLATNVMQQRGVDRPAPFLLLWLLGIGVWAAIFWSLRRRAGPVTLVERQIAHVWGASIVTNAMLYLIEAMLGLPVLTLSPVLGLTGGTVFLMKAAILSGEFYFYAAAQFVLAAVMARFPSVGITLFGVVTSLSFFLPGWKYWRQQRRRIATSLRVAEF